MSNVHAGVTLPYSKRSRSARLAWKLQRHNDPECTMCVMELFGRDTKEPALLCAGPVMPRSR